MAGCVGGAWVCGRSPDGRVYLVCELYAHMLCYCCVMCYDCMGTGCQVGGMSLTLSPPPGCTNLSWHAENASAHCTLFYRACVCVWAVMAVLCTQSPHLVTDCLNENYKWFTVLSSSSTSSPASHPPHLHTYPRSSMVPWSMAQICRHNPHQVPPPPHFLIPSQRR